MEVGAYLRLGANSRLGAYSNKYGRLFSQLILKLSKLDATFSAVSVVKTKK